MILSMKSHLLWYSQWYIGRIWCTNMHLVNGFGFLIWAAGTFIPLPAISSRLVLEESNTPYTVAGNYSTSAS